MTSEFENLLCRGERSFRQETPLALSPYRVVDPDDAVVLASALTAEADVLVTGDKALLNLAEAIRQAEGLLIIHDTIGRECQRRFLSEASLTLRVAKVISSCAR